jgi:galactokinase
MTSEERQQLISQEFRRRFGGEPAVWVRAPGRVDLMGSHTDYNMGYVMTMTIDRDTWLAVRPRPDRRVAVYSLNLAGGGEFDLDAIQHDPDSPWTDYVRGVALFLAEAGHRLTGFDGLIHSIVPFASGLSSSAAIEMAAGAAFQAVGGFQVDPVQMALIGQRAENRFVGVNSGILDQYSSAMGQAGSALLLDCRHLTSQVAPIAAGIRVVICDTRAERKLTGSEYGERRAQCEEGVRLLQRFYPGITALRDVALAQLDEHAEDLPDIVARRCRFIIEENQRVLDLAAALSGDAPGRLFELLSASYVGARDLYEIGAPAMSAMMAAMLNAPGVIGARQAGAGFGGCMVALVRANAVADFTAHVERDYALRTGIQPRAYPVSAAPGAGPV